MVVYVKNDLEFILAQIQIAEQHAALAGPWLEPFGQKIPFHRQLADLGVKILQRLLVETRRLRAAATCRRC